MTNLNSNWVAAAAMAIGFQAVGCQASVHAGLNTGAQASPSATTCGAVGQAAPTFDWEPARREAFSRAARQGVVVLRAQGCDWVVLEGCHTALEYEWQPHFSATASGGGSDGGVGVNIAGRASGGTRRDAERSSEVVTVGRKQLGAQRVSSNDLQGSCEGATHVVSRIAVGAFRITSRGATSSHVGIGPAAFAGNESWSGSVRQEGQPERCAANGNESQPGCSAAIEVAFAPIVIERPVAAPSAVAAAAPNANTSSPAVPRLSAATDPCAAGDSSACASQCSSGIASACTALTVLCARGDMSACAASGMGLVAQVFAMGR